MTNAKDELLTFLQGKPEAICVRFRTLDNDYEWGEPLYGTVQEMLPFLDFEYDSGYGTQHLDGIIWFADGSWAYRYEYDGSEYWDHLVKPTMPSLYT